MSIVIMVMSILICFLIYLVMYFWLDRNFYRDVSILRAEFCDKIFNFANKCNDDWFELCEKHNKEWTYICHKNNQEWAKAYAELQEENERLKNELSKKEV